MLLMFRHIFSGEFEQASQLAVEVTDYGRRFGDPDLVANGLNAQGRMLLYSGRVPEGLALLDEAMVGVATGDVSPIFAGEIYCSLIEACQEVSDYGRAAEWTSALTSWIDAQPGLVPFTGQCAVHRGQIMRVRGAFAEAVEEFRRATERYAAAGTPAPAGLAMAECGEVLRILGDLPAPRRRTSGRSGSATRPSPGARCSGSTVDARPPPSAPSTGCWPSRWTPCTGRSCCPAPSRCSSAPARWTGPREVADELAGHRGRVRLCGACGRWPPTRAGRVLLAGGQAEPAVPELRRAMAGWRSLDAPYEAARARLQLGRGPAGARRRGVGHRRDRGGPRDVRHASARLPPSGRRPGCSGPRTRPGSPTARSRCCGSWPGGAATRRSPTTLVLSEKTVARHLSNIFTKLDVGSRTAAAAFAFENGLA